MIRLQPGGGSRRHWTAADVPDQAGRTAVITGGSNGIGLEIARVLASRRAHLVLACRDVRRGHAAADRIGAAIASAGSAHPAVSADVVELDLSSLASVRAAAATICARYPRLDLLINNAGVMEVPYQRTADGFELTFATNHLGHFALTGLLLDALLGVPGSRIVTMSSQGHVDGKLNFADLQSERSYDPAGAYHQSKLANLLFTYELDRRHDTGYPVPVQSSPRSRDVADQARLWRVSEELTGVSYPLGARTDQP